MRVFISYSRQDSAFVSQVVEFLQKSHHEVWLDASDIRGSEEWRESVVTAIRSADVVILVVSPRSMASEDVEREITVAAEEHRQIVPVLLEHADWRTASGTSWPASSTSRSWAHRLRTRRRSSWMRWNRPGPGASSGYRERLSRSRPDSRHPLGLPDKSQVA